MLLRILPALKMFQRRPGTRFHDSPEGMRRFRHLVTETAGFANTVGFTDDTRAFLSIPARHDSARRIDCGFLAQLVAEHRLEEDEAVEVARRVRTGNMHVNGAGPDFNAPFGGYKQSGNGREWGALGLEEFLEAKAILGAGA